METLLHNPLAEMYGPYFLILYGGLMMAAFAISQFLQEEDRTHFSIPTVPSQPDPYQLAYLRGGSVYALELACFSLLQQGYLEVRGELFAAASVPPLPSPLNSLEQTVLDSFDKPRFAAKIRQDRALKNTVESLYRQPALEEKFLYSKAQQKRLSIFNAIALIFLLGLAGYKLYAALSNGHHNILYLSSMALAVAFYFLYQLALSPLRLTQRGRNYLGLIKMAFSSLKVRENDPNLSKLAIALFGASKLNNTPYEHYAAFLLFHADLVTHSLSSRTSGTSNGWGCGSGGGDGGCGGCGGCGGGD